MEILWVCHSCEIRFIGDEDTDACIQCGYSDDLEELEAIGESEE